MNFFLNPFIIQRRSFVLRGEEQRFSYAECSSLFLWVHMMFVWLSRGFGYFVGEPINFKPKSGEGPPSWLLRDGSFRVEVTAKATSGDGEQTTDTATAIVAGNGDPGYGATSKLLAELGLCLAFDEHDSSSCLEGGVLTPSTAVGEMYVERLRQCDFMTAVEIVVNGKKMN